MKKLKSSLSDLILGIIVVFSVLGGCVVDLEVGDDEFDTFEISSTLSMIDADKCVGEISFEIKSDSIFDNYLCTTKVYDYFLERCGYNEKD